MANINNETQIKFVLYTQSLANFEGLSNKDAGTIYFIAQDRTIYLDGKYYGVNASELTNLTNRISGNQSAIVGLQSDLGALATIIHAPIGVQSTGQNSGDVTQDYYINTISEALTYLDTQLEAVKQITGAQSVAEQISSAIATEIDKLDGIQSGSWQNGEDGPSIGVQVSTENGVVKTVAVEGNDIASATKLTGVQTTAESAITQIGEINTKISGIQTDLANASQGALDGAQAYTDEMIQGAQTYADAAALAAQNAAIAEVNNLAGANWADNAKKVQEIIEELEASDNANGWTTVADKIRGDFSYNAGIQGVQSDVKGYIDNAISNVSAGGVQGAQGKAAEAEANANSYTDGKLNDLDAGVKDTQTFVGVQVNQLDGKLIGVQVTESNIASTSDIAGVQGQLATNIQGVQSQISNINSTLTWTVL